MTNLHGSTANTKTLKNAWLTGLKESNRTQIISTMSGAAGIQTKCTGATHLTTINMYDPDDDHGSDYAEERHNSICEARDIDQGILSEEEE